MGTLFANDTQWHDFLSQNAIVKDRHVQIATEGVLIGSIIEHGISEHLVIVSDDAGQFNVLKKRKISGSTRSEIGRQCRDTFASLKKTCRKLGISFWQYLQDRIEGHGLVPDLPELIRKKALDPG